MQNQELPKLPSKATAKPHVLKSSAEESLAGRDVPDNTFKTRTRNISAAFTIFAIFLFNILPEPLVQDYISTPFILTCLIVFGIPHGAIDHILYYQVYQETRPFTAGDAAGSMSPERNYFESFGDNQGRHPELAISKKLRVSLFYFNYLTIMIFWMICWTGVPLVTFWTFLAVSAYHFWEGDMNYLRNSMLLSPLVMNFSRGFLLIGSLVTAQPQVTLPIIASLTRVSNPDSLFPNAETIRIVCVLQNLSLLALHVIAYKNNILALPFKKSHEYYQKWALEVAKSMLFTLLFNAINPLLAFAIYFGIWHAFGSVIDEIAFLKSRRNSLFCYSACSSADADDIKPSDILVFYKAATPYTLVAVLGMLAFLILDPMRSSMGVHLSIWDKMSHTTLWMVFIVSISVITGPHMWVMRLIALHWFNKTAKDGEEGPVLKKHSDEMDPLGLETMAKDWIIGGGWWWAPRKNKE
ncbi:beta-carotene 15,15'-dioxygenase-domain-containing protein [Obelidium mucronatum]|nr:beta-carotene 15,15'-dioxygenase-domain-containing protein [Obelidium mucronatum]